jgi:hypothetical protein
VYSYDGTMYVGFAGDMVALPDVELLRDYFDQEYAALKKAVLGRTVAATAAPAAAPKRRAAKAVAKVAAETGAVPKRRDMKRPKKAAEAPREALPVAEAPAIVTQGPTDSAATADTEAAEAVAAKA